MVHGALAALLYSIDRHAVRHAKALQALDGGTVLSVGRDLRHAALLARGASAQSIILLTEELMAPRAHFCRAWARRVRLVPVGAKKRAEARKRGVSDDRIHFTAVSAKDEHIKRGVLADLFLDTPQCNAHTTGCDILWGGCPMVTCLGGKRERNSQLQRLRSRPFSTRFG